MRKPIRAFIPVFLAVSACAAAEVSPPSSVGTYHGDLTIVEQDCYETLPTEPFIQSSLLRIYPQPDLGSNYAHARLEIGSWVIDAPATDVAGDGSFEVTVLAPNPVQPENAILRVTYGGDKIDVEYIQDRLSGSLDGGEPRPACSIRWTGSMERQVNVFWAVMTRGETVCDDSLIAGLPKARGFLLEIEQGYYDHFSFHSPGWQLEFDWLQLDENGRFEVELERENPNQPEHWVFEGVFDGETLEATYTHDLDAVSDPDLGDWPACRTVWSVIARHP